MNIKPLHDRVLIKRIEADTKTAGGIIIPDTAKEKHSEGIVEAAGNGFRADDGKVIPMSVKVGDTVLFATWSAAEVKVIGEYVLIVTDSDVMAVIGS